MGLCRSTDSDYDPQCRQSGRRFIKTILDRTHCWGAKLDAELSNKVKSSSKKSLKLGVLRQL
jgi:hypothetical protein